MTKQTPKPVNDGVRPKSGIGFGHILAQSGIVANAFGPDKGYRLMVLTILASALVSVGVVLLAVRGLVHILGW